jgi:hypothetical protein
LDQAGRNCGFLMPGGARLRTAVGGALHSLNARVARQAIVEASNWLSSAKALAETIQLWIDASVPAPQYARKRMSDDQVRTYIRRERGRDGHATRTALLRSLRDSGQACEQGRFRRLFAAITPKPAKVGQRPNGQRPKGRHGR